MIAEMVLHHLKLTCDAIPPAGLHCDVAAEWSAPSRDAVQLLAFETGWRVDMRKGKHICPTCMRRSPKLKFKSEPGLRAVGKK